mmetsp:Transcript_65470/g.156411  ORF Transcript_65470/g.156411 Transcript_65470/m.156411 type:complete len:272 (+) Transcript_65470:62-877(+)
MNCTRYVAPTIEAGVTSVSMRGLNRQTSRDSLVQLLSAAAQLMGERPKYDFVYLPWATRKACNIGLAFVNFEDHDSCKRFFEALHRYPDLLTDFEFRQIIPALIQGRGNNLRDTINKRGPGILEVDDAPLVFQGGQQISLFDVVQQELPDVWQQIQEETYIKPVRSEPRLVGLQPHTWPAGAPQADAIGGNLAQHGYRMPRYPPPAREASEGASSFSGTSGTRQGPATAQGTTSSSSGVSLPVQPGIASGSPPANALPLPRKLIGEPARGR